MSAQDFRGDAVAGGDRTLDEAIGVSDIWLEWMCRLESRRSWKFDAKVD